MDKFIVEANGKYFRVYRVTRDGKRFQLPTLFRTEKSANTQAYEMNVTEERRYHRRIYVGD